MDEYDSVAFDDDWQPQPLERDGNMAKAAIEETDQQVSTTTQRITIENIDLKSASSEGQLGQRTM